MSEFTLFHRPFNRSNANQAITTTKASTTSPRASSPLNTTTFPENLTPPTPQYNSVSQDYKHQSKQYLTDLEDPFGSLYPPSFSEVRYSESRSSYESDSMEMASPSKNNFARHISSTDDFSEDNDDTIMPRPLVEYDLTDNGFSIDSSMESRRMSAHKRNKSGESTNSTSTRWWKLGRQRHTKSNSASTHPISDIGRASSRSSSFTSTHGNDFDGRSSTLSFPNQSNWAVESPPISPKINNFSFPSHTHSSSQHLTDNRPSSSRSRDGHTKLEHGRALHSKKSSLSSVSNSHSRQRSAQSFENAASLHSSQDKWALALGHANYTVEPEPYTPDSFDLETWIQLLEDREAAHSDYCKQRARVIEHYGLNTKQFKLTEAKWAETNSEWEQNVRMAKRCLMAKGFPSSNLAASASSQTVRMPALNPHVDGKFPKLGDEDIVGPMAQSEPVYSRDPSPTRKTSAAKWKLDKIFHKPSNSN